MAWSSGSVIKMSSARLSNGRYVACPPWNRLTVVTFDLTLFRENVSVSNNFFLILK